METDPIKQFLEYPFHEDMAFLEGLQLLLGQPIVETFQRGGPISPELESSLLGPKLFFFNRQRNTNLTPEAVQAYIAAQPAPQLSVSAPPPSSSTPDEDRQLSLAELTRLIESGQTHLIPHNHVIPDGVQTEEPSPSKAPIRKKPWETGANTTEGGSGAEALAA
ncbi:hypothetical protein FS749_006881 [Ceratobasidium sp. UAMH 11750]|nr:hypothetical protein FS749_006881 [Ceratobasidium sp. UAMH 11750]